MIASRIPWDWVILGALRSGFEADLSEIYDTIEQSPSIINQRLLENEPRWGNRPKYQHATRAAITSLIRRCRVERVSRGRYQITDAGRSLLGNLENQ